MDIKEFLLAGGTLKASYKKEVMDWFGEISISLYGSYDYTQETKKVFVKFPSRENDFYPLDDLDKLIEEFKEHAFGKENIAPVWREVMKELNLDDVHEKDVPKIEEALRKRGYLQTQLST